MLENAHERPNKHDACHMEAVLGIASMAVFVKCLVRHCTAWHCSAAKTESGQQSLQSCSMFGALESSVHLLVKVHLDDAEISGLWKHNGLRLSQAQAVDAMLEALWVQLSASGYIQSTTQCLHIHMRLEQLLHIHDHRAYLEEDHKPLAAAPTHVVLATACELSSTCYTYLLQEDSMLARLRTPNRILQAEA